MVDHDSNTPRTRRAVLGAAAAAGAAAIASAVARPLPVLAGADDNADMFVGIQYGDVEATTGLTNVRGSQTVLRASSTLTATAGSGSGIGVQGTSHYNSGVQGTSIQGSGVAGQSNSGHGVHGSSSSGHAVWGSSTAGYGVFASSVSNAAVYATSESSVALQAVSAQSTAVHVTATQGIGAQIHSEGGSPAVIGWAKGGSTGVHGHSGAGILTAEYPHTGVMGSAIGSGTGGFFTSPTGNAIRVDGKASFSRSGRTSIPKNRSYIDITVPGGLASTAVVVATLQSQRGTCAVTSVRVNYPTTGKARIYLNKVASTTASTIVGWFVLG